MSSPALDQLPFTIHNLPYGIISTISQPSPRCAVAVGKHAIDLLAYTKTGRLSTIDPNIDFARIFDQSSLNAFATLPWTTRKDVRRRIQEDLEQGKVAEECLVLLSEVLPHLPMKMGGFSDFYSSLDHCKNCSGALTTTHIPKNWFYTPSVYNSRVSSVLPTPSTISRPQNVSWSAGLDSDPIYGPCRMLDFELEMGFFVSQPVPFGDAMRIENAKDHIFGFVMLNDWSARDHQMFEMRPLGPFHSKGFGTTISNWVTPMEALEPFRCATHLEQNPKPFPHLTWSDEKTAALDVKLRVKLVRDGREYVLSTSNLKYLYWTPYQQITHHAASGCGLETGDLMGTGTISGSGRDGEGRMVELGCLYEAQRTGTSVMPARSESLRGYEEGYLEDGDEVVLEGWCEDEEGKAVLGLGECRGRIVAPR